MTNQPARLPAAWRGATELAPDREVQRLAATGLAGYWQDQGRLLHCLHHKPAPASRYVDFQEVTAEDLPDGGTCVHPSCGADLLAVLPTPPRDVRFTDGDRQAITEFKACLADRAAEAAPVPDTLTVDRAEHQATEHSPAATEQEPETTGRHTVDSITSDQLDDLQDRLDRAMRALDRGHVLAEGWQGDQTPIARAKAAEVLMEAIRLTGWTRSEAPPEQAAAPQCAEFIPDTPRAPDLCARCGDSRRWHQTAARAAEGSAR